MKKLIFLFAIYMIPVLSFAQTWETLKIDSAVSVKLPKGFTITETDKKYSLLAISPFGTILNIILVEYYTGITKKRSAA